jgi:hypothetical protein
MVTVSAKFDSDDDDKLNEICQILHIDKSEALRQGTQQLWLALQIGIPFVERAGGRPQYLLNSGDRNASSRKSRKQSAEAYLDERASRRKKSGDAFMQSGQ